MNIRSMIPLAALTLAASLVSGCGGSSNDDGETRLSIASIMGQDSGYDQSQYQEQEAQIQDLIATCMAEQGWEYIPIDYPDMDFTITEEDELERRQREGFGIAYWTLNQGNDEDYVDPFEDWVDPNQAIVEAMSEDESSAYYESLWGTQEEQEENMIIEVDPDTGEEYYMQTGYGPGCYGEAQEAIYGSDPTQDEDYWQAIGVFYEELYERVEADPRIRALNDEWARCMAEQGYTYDDPSDLWSTTLMDLQTRHEEIVGDLYSRDPFEGWTQEEMEAFWESSTQEEVEAFYGDLYAITDEQRAALEALLAEEIELAVVEYSCSGQYGDQYQEISTDIEEQYALEHQEELEALAVSLGVKE